MPSGDREGYLDVPRVAWFPLSVRHLWEISFDVLSFTCSSCSHFSDLRAQTIIRDKFSDRMLGMYRIPRRISSYLPTHCDTSANSCNVVQKSLASLLLSVIFSVVEMSRQSCLEW